MNMILAGLIGDAAPGVSMAVVLVAAAVPARAIMQKGRHGRARSAIAYLSGLMLGVWIAVILSATARHVAEASLLGAFVGPFIGLAWGKWQGPRERIRRAKA